MAEVAMGALEAALRGLGCQCGGDTDGHGAAEHMTASEREIYEQIGRDLGGLREVAFGVMESLRAVAKSDRPISAGTIDLFADRLSDALLRL